MTNVELKFYECVPNTLNKIAKVLEKGNKFSNLDGINVVVLDAEEQSIDVVHVDEELLKSWERLVDSEVSSNINSLVEEMLDRKGYNLSNIQYMLGTNIKVNFK